MEGMVRLTMTAELDGTRVQVSRARSVEELRAMKLPEQGYRQDAAALADELRAHVELLVTRSP